MIHTRAPILRGTPALRRSTLFGLLLAACALLLARPAQAQDEAPAPPHVFLPIVEQTLPPAVVWPLQNSADVSPNTWLEWYADPAVYPDARYTVYLGLEDSSPDTVIARDLTRMTATLTDSLEPGRRYYWQVAVESSNGNSVTGPVWSFDTFISSDPPDLTSKVIVPAGEYLMGCDPENDGGVECRDREVPLHAVYTDAFAIDRYEVTNLEYRACVYAGECPWPRRLDSLTRESYFLDPAYDYFPVLYVSWWNAREYCAWDGGRLPTEAEWEKAAKGTGDMRPWPWGFETIDCTRANYTGDRVNEWILCVGDTDRVGARPRGASAYGVMDMSGNVFEWVHDRWDVRYYYSSPYLNPQGPWVDPKPGEGPGDKREFVIRGGSYRPRWYYPRTFFRHYGHHGDRPLHDQPDYRNNQVGFRCAWSLP